MLIPLTIYTGNKFSRLILTNPRRLDRAVGGTEKVLERKSKKYQRSFFLDSKN